MFAVYRAYGPKSNLAYYGYASDANASAREAFITGASRPEAERADVRLLAENGGDPDLIKVEIVDVADDELTAWMLRNDLRASSVDTISGPTMFPGNIAERVAKDHPEKIVEWRKLLEWKKYSTAREAYAAGKWTMAQIKSVAEQHGRAIVLNDLDTLTPAQFEQKYF